jgi:hypothetical protein
MRKLGYWYEFVTAACVLAVLIIVVYIAWQIKP